MIVPGFRVKLSTFIVTVVTNKRFVKNEVLGDLFIYLPLIYLFISLLGYTELPEDTTAQGNTKTGRQKIRHQGGSEEAAVAKPVLPSMHG